jgi:hypothetical protein
MLLLENYFFFAPEFCTGVIKFAKSSNAEKFYCNRKGYIVRDREIIGDLTGAIHGIRFTGFIGEVYKVFPFPEDLKNFKQSPDGYKNRKIIEKIIVKYASSVEIPFSVNSNGHIFQIAEFQFTNEQFTQLINYVLQGGYPRWKENKMPDYVKKMKDILFFRFSDLWKGFS